MIYSVVVYICTIMLPVVMVIERRAQMLSASPHHDVVAMAARLMLTVTLVCRQQSVTRPLHRVLLRWRPSSLS